MHASNKGSGESSKVCTDLDESSLLIDATATELSCAGPYTVKRFYHICHLSYVVASGSKITPCNKICKPLVVYRFTGNVMTSITTLRT